MPQTYLIPADVPTELHQTFQKNMKSITHGTGNLFLFACDQKIEHLNADFSGSTIHPDAQRPEHLFEIAQHSPIGAMATQNGLIERYGPSNPNINYIAKLNSKTNLLPAAQVEPDSTLLWGVHDILQIAEQSKLKICGIGLTVYLGSEFVVTVICF